MPDEIQSTASHGGTVTLNPTTGPFIAVGNADEVLPDLRLSQRNARRLEAFAITVSLAPAELRKSAAALDLAIAVGVLKAIGQLPESAASGTVLLGELSLDGSLQAVRGVLPQLDGARARGVRRAIVPASNAAEAGLVRRMDVRVASHVEELYAHWSGGQPLPAAPATQFAPDTPGRGTVDMSDVRGQSAVRRALEIAAAGNHNVLRL